MQTIFQGASTVAIYFSSTTINREHGGASATIIHKAIELVEKRTCYRVRRCEPAVNGDGRGRVVASGQPARVEEGEERAPGDGQGDVAGAARGVSSRQAGAAGGAAVITAR
jgi:hypothetical protein